MDTNRFDRLARAAADPRSRRRVLRLLLGSALGMGSLAALNPAAADATANAADLETANVFGCLNVGQRCHGHDAACCSGVCRGKEPKPGRRDRRRCAAHDVGGCTAGQDFCAGATVACGTDGICFRTTGNASFCGLGGAFLCQVCAKDADCVALGFRPGVACVACSACDTTGGTACIPSAA